MIEKAHLRTLLLGFIIFSYTAYATAAEPVEVANKKAENYHKLLLKKPGNATVFNRFINAWLDTGEKKDLSAWLKQRAESGEVADLRVLAAYHEYLGEEEEALSVLSKAAKKEPANASLRMARAKMLARSLSFDEALKDLEVAAKDKELGIEASKLKGVYLARSGQIKNAVAAWKEVIARFPKDAELREDLIELLVVEGLYDDAVTSSKELIAMTKDPYMKVVRQMRLADIQILAGKREDGMSTYKQVLDATGEGTWIEREVLARFEKVYLREDNIKGLRELYQEIREKYPRRISIQKALAYQMAATGEINEAIELFKDVIKITPGNMKNRQDFMNFLEKNEKWEEAKAELTDLLKSRKTDPLIWQKLAQMEQQLANTDGIKEALSHVWEIKKTTPEGVITTATLYDQAELKKDAEQRLREGRKLFADSDEVKEALASFLIQNKKEKEAVEIWSKMAKDAPRDVLLRVVRSLAGHDKSAEAFGLLVNRVGEFENDVLVLSKLCALVTDEDAAKTALPHALNLINKATTPTDLETYMRLAVQVVNSGGQGQAMIDQLSAKPTPSIAECCLLAELFTNTGDTIGAEKYLKKAEEIDQGLLAKFYRVHYNESRGDLEKSVTIMEGILTSPDGKKTVYMRRLVGLLQRDGRLGEALTRTEEWKRMAPGDRSAWQKRADILALLGRPDESVTELRRMLGKFGSEETLRASLASRLLDSGEYQAARKIYEQLYDEADSLQGKLKWVAEMAQLAQQEGNLAELLDSFDQRNRSNPQSIEPLLAKAEIYRVLNQYNERREMLLQATQKRPNDAQLLMRMAEVEEQAGELDQAMATLRQAALLDKTFESKSKLATLLIRNGETNAGLSLLAQIPSESSDPRKVEKTIESLIKSGEPELALGYLKKLPQHHADWRLLYLKGHCLLRMGKEQEAYELFVSMKNVSGEIKGVSSLIKPQQARHYLLAIGNQKNPTFKGWIELSHYLNFIRNEESILNNMRMYGRSYSSSYGRATLINLPGTAKEAAYLGILRAAIIANQFPAEKKQKAWSELSLEGVEELELFMLSYLNRYQQNRNQNAFNEAIAKRLEKDPNNPILLTYWLRVLKPESAPSKERALEILEAMKKHSSFSAVTTIQTLQNLKVFSQEESMTSLLGLYDAADEKEKDELVSVLINRLWATEGVEEELKKQITEFRAKLLQRVYQMEDEPKNSWWVNSLLNQLLADDKGDEAVRLINHLCKWEKNRKPINQQAQQPMRIYGHGGHWRSGYRHGHSHSGRYLVPPPAYPTTAKGVHPMLTSMVSNNLRRKQVPASTSSTPAISAEQKKLLKLLAKEPAKKKTPSPSTQATVQNAQPFKALKGKTDQIEHPLLRAMILLVSDDEDSMASLAKQLEKSDKYDELLMAAGYYHEHGENHQKVYEILKRLSSLSGISATDRKKLDGYLVYIGGIIAKDKDNKADLEPVKRAALRIRKNITGGEKTTLLMAMKSLGLSEEVERMTKARKSLATVTRSGSRTRPLRGLSLSQMLIQEGKKEEAVRESVREIRRLLKQGSNSRSQISSYISFLKKHELVNATIKKMTPTESASFNHRLTFADFCMVLGEKEKARSLYEDLLKDRPKSLEALTGWITVVSHEEAAKKLFIKDGDDKFDFSQIDAVLNQMSRVAENDVDTSLKMLSVMAGFLEVFEPSIDDSVNLSWVNYHTARRVRDNYFTDYRLVDLMGANSSGKVTEKNAKKSDERDAVARRLFESMLKHSQTAEQGFLLLEASKNRLKVPEDELLKFAKKAAAEMIRRPVVQSGYSGSQVLWTRHGNYGSHSTSAPGKGTGPLEYLISIGVKTRAELLDQELLASIKKHQPERYKRIVLVQALSKADEKEALATFEEWTKSLPENIHEKNSEIYSLIDVILLVQPKSTAWTGALQKLILDDPNRGYSGSNWSNARAKWARWIHTTQGSGACQKFIEEIIARRLAPKEKWPILVKLGNRHLPSEYRQNIYSIEAVFNTLYADPIVAGVATRVIIDNNFTSVFSNSSYRLRNLWNISHQSPEDFIKWLKKNGFADKQAKGEVFEPARVFFVSEGISQVRFTNSKMKEAAAKLLMSDKELDPILAQTMAAKMLGQTKGREIMAQTIANNPKDFAALKSSSQVKAQAFIKYWFPTLKSDASNAKLEKYLKTFRQDLLAEAKSKAATWMKEGITLTHGSDYNRDFIPYVVQIIQNDPYEGAALWIKIIDDVRKQSAILAAGNPYYQSNSSALHDQWNSRLLNQIVFRSSSSISRVDQVKFLHRLYQGSAGDYLMEPSSYNSSFGYYFWDSLNASVKTKKVAKGEAHKTVVLAIEAMAKKLTEDEQATMMVLMQQGLSSRLYINSNDRVKYLEWVSARYAGRSDPVASGMKAFALQNVWRYVSTKKEEKELQQKKEREAFLAFLQHKGLSVAMRTELIRYAAYHSNSWALLASEEMWREITKLITEYNKESRSTYRTVWGSVISNLVAIKFDGREKVSGPLAREAESLLLSAKSSSSNNQTELTKAILMLGLDGGDTEIIRRHLKTHIQEFRGNMALMLGLAKQKEYDLAKRLLAPDGVGYNISGLGSYDENFHKLSQDLIQNMPEQSRYRLEVVLSSRSDPSKPKPTVGRKDRMIALAKRYAKEKPSVRVAKIEVLAHLSDYPESSKLVEKDLLEEAARTSYAKLIFTHSSSRDRAQSYQLIKILKRVTKMDVEAGRYEKLAKDLKALRLIAGSNEASKASSNTVEILRVVNPGLMIHLLKNQDTAKQMLPLAEEIVRCSAALAKYNSGVRRCNEPIATIIYCLAGKADEYDALMKSMTKEERENYKKYLLSYGFSSRASYLIPNEWKTPENSEARRKVFTTLLSSEWFMEQADVIRLTFHEVVRYGTLTKEDLFAIIPNVPDTNINKPKFLCAKCGIMSRGGKPPEELDKIYAQALALAKAQKNEKAESLVLLRRCVMWTNKGKLDQARKWGKLVKPDLLEKNNADLFARTSKRLWKKAPNK